MNILTRNTPRQYLRNGDLNLSGEGLSYFSYGLSGMTGGYLPALPMEEGGYLVEDIVTFSSLVIMNKIKSEHLYIEGDTDILGDLNITGEFTINGEPFEGGANYLSKLKDVYYNWENVPVEKWDVPHGYLAYWGNSLKWSYRSRELHFWDIIGDYLSWLYSYGGFDRINEMFYQYQKLYDKTLNLYKVYIDKLDVDELSIGGNKFDILIEDPWDDDLLVWDSEEEKWVNKHTGKVVVYDPDKNYTATKPNHSEIHTYIDLDNIPYTPLEEFSGVNQYQYIQPNAVFGGHIYATQRIAFTSPTFIQEDSSITLQENDSRRIVTYLDVRDDYEMGTPQNQPTYTLKTYVVSDDSTEVWSEADEVEIAHSGNLLDKVNESGYMGLVFENINTSLLTFKSDPLGDGNYESSGKIVVNNLTISNTEDEGAVFSDYKSYLSHSGDLTFIGAWKDRIIFRTLDYGSDTTYTNYRDITHYVYDQDETDPNKMSVTFMLDTGNFSRLMADSSGEFHFTVQRARFLQNNYGACYFTNDGKLYLYDYVNNYSGKLGFNADGHLVVDGIEGYYTKEELYTKDQIDTTVEDLRYEFNTNLDSLEARVNQKIEDKFDVISPDTGGTSGSNLSKIDDRLSVVEGRLDDIELMLDKILGTETNTYLNNKLDEILEG